MTKESQAVMDIKARARAVARYLPILDWGKRYDRQMLTSDLVAAVIVTIMLIPQSLAYALLADRLRARIERPAVIQWLSRLGGGALVAMGLLTATLRRPTL